MAEHPIAFFCYVRQADKHEARRLTSLRQAIEEEVGFLTKTPFKIFQDRDSLEWGDNWRKRINASIEHATFLIPVITPTFFESKECCREVRHFLKRERELGRGDLLLPIYYADNPHLEPGAGKQRSPLAKTIAARQRSDWRELRFTGSLRSKKTREAISEMAKHLVARMIETTRPLPVTPNAVPPTPKKTRRTRCAVAGTSNRVAKRLGDSDAAPHDAIVSPHRTRILLVDDHPVLRRGITELINSEGIYEVCAEAGTLSDAYIQVAKCKPELCIVDIGLDGNNGLELIKEIKFRWTHIRTLAYSMHDEQIYAVRALKAGADGYVMKQHPPEELFVAIKTILKGRTYLSPSMSARLLGHAPVETTVYKNPVDKLSERELEVFALIGKGMTTAQVADKLCLSVKTIETYREHLKQKLSLKSGPELVRYAIEWSLSQS